MKHPLLDAVDKKYRRTSELDFTIGDTVVVTLRIVEGTKERLQDFEGTVIARRGAGLDEMFTVRRLIGNEGVERTFPLHTPRIVSIKAVRSGKVRRCKLYFLRDRVGKARRLREKRISAEARRAAAEARASKARALRDAQDAVAASKATENTPADTEMAGTPS
jgi:large subunit ribosomal protein L19